jgi:endo-1,4-beta-D-glucanase Y
MTRALRVVLLVTLLAVSVSPLQAQDDDLLAPLGVEGETVYIPFPVSITLDGNLADWAGVPFHTVTWGPSPSPVPEENGSFTFALASDGVQLYIAMTMPDKTIIAGKHGKNFWNEDSLEFFVNLSGDFWPRGYSDGMHQVNITPTDIGNTDPAAITVTGVRASSLPVQAFVFATADGWGFEAVVSLGGWLTPAHGAEIGFQAQANGAAVADRNVLLSWSKADTDNGSWQNPGLFGRALFFEIGQTDLPQPSQPPEGPALVDWTTVDWGAMVEATWEGYKAHYIFCGPPCGDNLGLVFDPNMGYQAVSEGVGYGLLMAVMMDDQSTFDTVYDAAHTILLDEATGLFNWRADNAGQITGFSSATDAELDIAAALIFAQARVEGGEWSQHPGRPYGERARSLLDSIYLYEVADGKYLTPGDAWGGGGRAIINLSYFAPAWFRIFDAFEGGTRWEPLIHQGYRSLFSVPRGNRLGLAPDWSTANGRPAFEFCDAEGRPREACRFEMTYDAIRVPWRIGVDCLWFGDTRACEWSQRSAAFLTSIENPNAFAVMYDMDGKPVVGYQNELMAGMWIVAALASGDTDLQLRLGDLLYGFASNALSAGHWGGSPQYYFNQSLAWFGASLLSGDFRNLYASPGQ